MSDPDRQELVTLLFGSAHVLVGFAQDFETCARHLAGLDEQFVPRLRRYGDEAVTIASSLRQLGTKLSAPAPGHGGGEQR